MENYELCHYGVKGMKWGVRRTAQQLRTAKNLRTEKKLRSYKDISRETKTATDAASRIVGGSGRNKLSKQQKKHVNAMSDAELRAKLNRMNMEQQYADLNPSRTTRGRAAVASFLETAGNIITIAGSAAGIMLAAKQLRG